MPARSQANGTVHPRVRGERVEPVRLQAHRARFIPACAGNALIGGRIDPGASVHPRVRGERLPIVAIEAGARRFIPACAGNALTASHPVISMPGSSPRARGTRPAARQDGPLAGSSPRARGTRRDNRAADRPVHPRVRGERSYRKRLFPNHIHDVNCRTGGLPRCVDAFFSEICRARADARRFVTEFPPCQFPTARMRRG